MSAPELVIVANARIPSQRAQSLQVVQVAGAFQRQGARTTLLHARRVPTPPLPPGQDVWDYYGVPAEGGERPAIEALPCVDWIDRVPARLQYWPARVQELTFARTAAKRVLARHADATVLSRELEAARTLVRRGHDRTYLEIHRVPGGDRRRAWLREAAAGCRGVVAISGGVREDLVALGVEPSKIVVEHDGYEAARFAHPPAREAARERLGVGADAQVVVYTGGLLPWKGVDVLVDLARGMPELTFLIVGGMDADVQRLRARLRGAGNVRLEGFQPPARVVEYLAAADVGVAPNRSQPAISARYTSPLKVFEAMAMGLPLVVSDLPSLREILGEDEAFFVPADDGSALRLALIKLFKSPELRARLGAALHRRAPEHTWDARAVRLLEWMGLRPGPAA